MVWSVYDPTVWDVYGPTVWPVYGEVTTIPLPENRKKITQTARTFFTESAAEEVKSKDHEVAGRRPRISCEQAWLQTHFINGNQLEGKECIQRIDATMMLWKAYLEAGQY